MRIKSKKEIEAHIKEMNKQRKILWKEKLSLPKWNVWRDGCIDAQLTGIFCHIEALSWVLKKKKNNYGTYQNLFKKIK